MEVVLTPVEESEEDISFEAATESELRGLESQYHKENCVMSASAMSTQQISEKNSLDKYKCSISNCETCRKQSHTILSKEINSHLLDPKKYVVQSQSIDKSDPQSVTRSKSNSKQEDLVIQKSKGKVKNTMGSASSVSKNKKQAKPRTKQDVLKNSDLRAQSRLQKGQEYEAKTSKTLKRIEAKYKATGSASFSSLQGQNTPVIEDVYPAKEDNADQLLKKVKVTTTNLPYHIRSRSAPSKKRTPAKQQDLPKSSRVNKGIKKSADAEETSKTPRKLIENTETEQQNEELGDEKGKACDTDRAQLSSKDIVPDIGIECVIEELNSEFNNGVDDLRYALHGIKHGLPYIQQPALNEGVEEIILIDPPPEFGSLSNNMENHESITSKRSDYDPGTGSENDLFRWKIDPKNPTEDQNNNVDKLDWNEKLTKNGCEFLIELPSTSESSTDHSLSTMSDKSASSCLNKQSHPLCHETSLSSGSSLQTALQAMFDLEFNEQSQNGLSANGIVLEDVESSSNDQESDVDISSDFVMTPSHEPEPESMEDSLELAVPRSIPPQLSTIVNRPISSKAWDWNANDKCENPFVKDVSETNEHKGLPFERYQQAAGENISSDDDKPAATSDINVGSDCLAFKKSIPSTSLTKQAVRKHNLLHNKHLDGVKDTESHYKDEDRAHMQSRLSSATTTTDFSIVTDSTVTVDVDDSEFVGLKKGKELGHGSYGTVFEGLTADGKLIAVKQVELTISNREIADKEYKRVQCEVNLLRSLQHKNVVRLLGTSFDGACVRIYMEHVPGGSIKSIVTQYGALHERIFRKYTKQILEGLVYLHSSGVVHRDIKGSNVMLMTNGTIKLIDFGCAKRLRESALLRESSGSRDAKLLKTMLGTPYWMAPEVITSQGHGPKSDIWSVGATVYEMATAHPPLKNLEATAALFHIGCGNAMPELPRECSRYVNKFVKKCFTRDQYQRPSASELLNHRFMTHQKGSKLKPTSK